MKHYELMYIVDPSAEEGIDEVKQKIEGIITGREGSVLSFEKLGRKRLSYTIAKHQYGVYFLVNFQADGRIVQALDYYLRLNPLVLRHIILAFSTKQIKLRQVTEQVQIEEAERMRLGGRPKTSDEDIEPMHVEIGPKVDLEGEETAVETVPEVEDIAEKDDNPPIESSKSPDQEESGNGVADPDSGEQSNDKTVE